MIIDMHTHPFCKEATVNPGQQEAVNRLYGKMADVKRFKNLTVMFDYIFNQRSIEDIIADMDDNKVDKAVIVSMDLTTAYGVVLVTNEDVADFSSKYPDRFIPFAGIDPAMGRSAVDRLTHAVEDLGCTGMKLVPPVQKFNISDPGFNPLWEKAIGLGIIVWSHTAHQMSMPGTDARLGHPMLIEAVALRYPELTIVMGHCGFPWMMEAASVAARHPNVYIDISAYPDLYNHFPWDIYTKFDAEGKVLFATDNPIKTTKETLEALGRVDISQEFKDKILGENAKGLLGL